MGVATSLKKPLQFMQPPAAPSRGIDGLLESHAELLRLVETHYERTGDLQLRPIIERAKEAVRGARD